MIYITSGTTELLIPKVSLNEVTGITFENQITHKVISTPVTDLAPFDFMYKFNISSIIPQFEVGQYDYKVNGEFTFANGIAQFGDFKQTPTAYTQDITIKQYNG